MALQSTTEIFIGGNPILAYQRMMLHQEIDAHHMLELICRMDVLENLSGDLASQTRDFLGETITVRISAVGSEEGYKELEFKGIVSSVNNTKGFYQQQGDLIVIKAYSCSIITDDGPHYDSHNDVGLAEILDQTFQGYSQSMLETAFNPVNSDNLHYSVQHNESSFAYASRLAAQYGEWFYYDGKKLVFGKPGDQQPVELRYGMDLQEFSLQLNPIPNNFRYFTNDYFTNEYHEISTEEITTGVNGFTSIASDKGKDIFAKETQVYVSSYDDPQLKRRLDQQVGLQKKATEMSQVTLQGVSDNPGGQLGEVIRLKGDASDYGSFRITSISHNTTENGKYQNRFTGVSADIDSYPNTNMMAYPKSDTQVAEVKENADPEGLGRIRVQFPWQKKKGELSPWLRIVSPHAGLEKGFHFIPEIGEEVLIGFEGGNAERPYVLGALYHGKAKPEGWRSDKNDLKVIRSRSGHTIELNDKDGEETIKIYDNEGSIITFDTRAKSLYVQSAENMEFAAKNIKMVAEENIEIQAKGDINTASEGDTVVQSKGATNLQATGNTSISSDASINMEAKTDAKISAQNVTSEGKVTAEIKGQQTKVQGQMTVIQGASGKIDVV